MSNGEKVMKIEYFVFATLTFILVLTACGERVTESKNQPELPLSIFWKS